MLISALRRRAIEYAFVFSCFLLAATIANAESELQKLFATIPFPGAKADLYHYQVCAANTGQEAKKKGASFQEAETAIARECKKNIVSAERALAQNGMSADQRAKLIERFNFLALTERQLKAEGKLIPGYQLTEHEKCDRKSTLAQRVYMACVEAAWQGLLPLSTDTSDVVADAAVGMCSSKRSEFAASLLCFSVFSPTEVNSLVSKLDQNLRSSALGKIVAARAAMRQRELLQKQAPKPQSPTPGSKHNI